MNKAEVQYRPDIDGLRAIAVLSVVVFHLFGSFLPGGFVGVDIFFVISGFLITSIIARDLEAGHFSIKHFYIKRIRRIFPSLIVVFVSVLVAGWILLLPEELANLGKHVTSSTAFIQNFILMKESGYFDPASELKPLLHLWSLSIEEQFYLFWPLLMIWFTFKRIKLIFPILIFILLSFFFDDLFQLKEHTSIFYLTPSRVWQILFGAAIAVNPWHKNLSEFLSNFFSFIGIIFIIGSMFFLKAFMEYPGILALFPTIGTALLIGTGPDSVVCRVLSRKPLIFFGLISYPLYLWHWPLFSFVHIISSGEVSIFFKVIILILSIVLAILTLFLIETPLRRSKNEKVPVYLLGSIIMCCSLGFSFYMNEGFKNRKTMKAFLETNKALVWKTDTASIERCTKIIPFAKIIDYCQLSSPDSSPTVALIGDSHAHHFYPGLVKNIKHLGENVILLGKGSCPSLIGFKQKISKGSSYGCDEVNKKVFDYLLKTPSIHTIYIANLGSTYLTPEKWKIHLNKTENGTKNQFLESVELTFKTLSSNGKKINYVLNVPRLDFDPKACIKHRPYNMNQKPTCILPRVKHNKVSESYYILIKKLAEKSFVNVLDPTDILCNNSTCIVKNKQRLLYRDDNHLTMEGSYFVGRIFKPD